MSDNPQTKLKRGSATTRIGGKVRCKSMFRISILGQYLEMVHSNNRELTDKSTHVFKKHINVFFL